MSRLFGERKKQGSRCVWIWDLEPKFALCGCKIEMKTFRKTHLNLRVGWRLGLVPLEYLRGVRGGCALIVQHSYPVSWFDLPWLSPSLSNLYKPLSQKFWTNINKDLPHPRKSRVQSSFPQVNSMAPAALWMCLEKEGRWNTATLTQQQEYFIKNLKVKQDFIGERGKTEQVHLG